MPDPDTFGGKVLLNAIDKIIIGGIAAIILAFFQYQAHQYQLIQDASATVSQIHTGILLTQRKEIIELMENYYVLIENIKSTSKPADKEQINKSKEYLNRVRFLMFTLTPRDRLKEVAENFLTSIHKQYPMNLKNKSAALAILQKKITAAVEEAKDQQSFEETVQSIGEIYPLVPDATLAALQGKIKELSEEQQVKETAEKFLQSISNMNVILALKITAIPKIDEQEKEIKEAYLDLLATLRKMSIRTVKSEIRTAE